MSRKILKSNGAFVLIGDSPSWKTTYETGRLFSLVQNVSFGVTNERQQLKQVGYENYAINHINRAPSVNLNIDYYLSPYLNNELLLGFAGLYNTPTNLLNRGLVNSDNNFYIVVDNTDGADAITEAREQIPAIINFNGCNVISFGNCYLTKYSLSFSVGSIPTVSTSYSCSNMKIDDLTNNTLTIPAINHQSGNANGAGTLNLAESTYPILSGYLGSLHGSKLNISKLPIAHHANSIFSLQNLQVGGVLLESSSSPILQNLDINLDFKRSDLYGLGSNYVYDRKLELPINATVDIQALVSGVSSGFISGLLNNENDYDFDISFSNPTNIKATGFYKFKNAKLENFNYSMQVNQIMNFSASFSVQINNTDGFYISRKISAQNEWVSIDDLWYTTNISWQV